MLLKKDETNQNIIIMKKTVQMLLLVAALLLPWVANAQSHTAAIGNWNSTTAIATGGFYFGAKYSWSQTLYLENEMGGAGYIQTITFDNRSSAACTADSVKIYLGKTPMTSHPTANVSTWVPMDSLTLVFRATNWTVPADTGDLTITLPQPYYYDGHGTLAVVISKANSGTTSTNTKFGYTSITAMAKYTGSTTVSYCRFPTVAGTNSAYKFNIRFGMTATAEEDYCPYVPNFRVTDRTSSSVTVAWDAEPGENYDVGYTDADGTEDDIEDYMGLNGTYTFTNLDEATPYKFYVRRVCTTGEGEWQAISISTLAPPQELPLTLDFEDADDDVIWNFLNGPNGWYVDSLGDGRALFISNDNGATNAYATTTTAGTSWAWVDVELDAGGYNLAFDWKAKGESNYDYMRAFLVPASVLFTNDFSLFGQTTTTNARNVVPEGWVLLGSKHRDSLYYNMRDRWQHVELEFTVPTTGVYHLAFLWSNDGGGGAQPPAAIDSIVLTEASCYAPLSYTIDSLNTTSSTVTMDIHHPTATSFLMVWRPKGRTWYDTVEVTGDSYQFTDLAMGALYEGYIYSLCGGDTSVSSLPFEFFPPCGGLTANDLPYTETFEAYGSGSDYPINSCWHKGVEPVVGSAPTTKYPYPNSANAINGQRSLYFYAYRYGSANPTTAYYNWMTLPELDESLDVSDLMVEFAISRSASANSSTYTYSTTLVVGVSSDITSETAFVPVDTIDLSSEEPSTMRNVEVNFSSYTGTGKYILFYAPVPERTTTVSYHVNNFYIDDITLMVIPSCFRPTAVTADSVANDAVTLRWTPDPRTTSPTSWLVEYGPEGFTDETAQTENVSGSDFSVTITGLTAATRYEFRVSAVCGTDASEARALTVTTLCDPATLPFFEGFETTEGTAYNTAGVAPVCWDVYTNGTSAIYMPHVVTGTGSYSYYRTGEKGLAMTSGTSATYGTSKYVVLPEMEAPLNLLQLSFWMCTEGSSATTGALTVGYLTNGNDTSTFVPIQAYPASSATAHSGNGPQPSNGLNVVLELANLPANAARLAFKWGGMTSSFYTCCIDDVALDSLPTCTRPQGVAITHYNDTEAELVIDDSTYVNNYIVNLIRYNGNTAVDTAVFNSDTTVVTFTSLLPGTNYQVEVVSDCGDGTYTRANSTTFRTACAPIDTLPYYEDFEAYVSGSANPIDSCWRKHVVGTATQYPYPYATNAIEGNLSLYFVGYNSTSATTATYYSFAALPAFDAPLNTLRVSFKLRRYTSTSATYSSQMLVGVMGNPDDFSTFDTLQFIDLTSETNGSIHEFEVSLANYTGTGSYIAFCAPKPAIVSGQTYCYNYIYLDSVVVSELPTCQRPTQVTFSDVTAHTATVSWSADADSYEVEYADNADFTNATSVTGLTDASTVITGLNSYSRYYVRVRATCGTLQSEWSFPEDFLTEMDCGANGINIVDTIGTATTTSAYIFYTSSSTYPMGLSTHLFSVNEMLGMGLQDTNYIYSIKLHAGSTAGTIRKAKIYMTETSLSAIGSTAANDTISRGSMTLVYSGNIQTTANQWVEIMLDTPFLYTGTQNLAVCLSRDTAATAAATFYYTTTSPDYVSYYAYTNTNGSTSATRTFYRPNIVFNICSQVPTCPRPANVALTAGDDTSFTLTWQGSAAGYEVMVSRASVNPDTVTLPAAGVTLLTATGSPFMVGGLNDNTTYYYYVRSVCTGETSTWSPEGVYTTACSPMTLPFTEDFEGYGTGSTAPISPCWTKGTNSSTAYPYPYATSAINGDRSLYFYGYNSSSSQYYSYAALPMMADSVKNLMISFNVRRYNSSTATYTTRLVVGVMTNPDDISTFFPMDTIDLYTAALSSVHGYEFFFNNYTGDGQYIAIYDAVPPLIGTNTTCYSYAYVDDIVVDRIPSCLRPKNVTVNNIGQTTATVHWTGAAANYEVEYGPVGFDHGRGTTVTATVDSVDLTGLAVGTQYDVYVRAVCADTNISEWSFMTRFFTGCGTLSVPYFEGFEGYESGATQTINPCWTKSTNHTSTDYPYPFVTNAITGQRSLYFYGYRPSSGTNIYSYVALPEFDVPVNTLEISFNMRRYSTTTNYYTSLLVVGVMSNPANINTFVGIDTIDLKNEPSLSIHEINVSFADYAGTGTHIALLAPVPPLYGETYTYNYLYVDDILVDLQPACPRATGLTATNATQNSVVLGWTDTIGSTQWKVSYALDTSDSWTEVTAGSNPYTLTGLTPNTIYRYRVAPVCANGETSSWSLMTCRFSTSQVPAAVPYSYDFEDAAEWQNWQTISNNNAKWYRGIVADVDSSNTMYLSTDNGATNSWLRTSITNSAAYRDIDFGSTPGGFAVTFRCHNGGNTAAANDGITVLVEDPATIPVSSSTYLESPWGHFSIYHARLDTVWGTHTVLLDSISGVRRLVFLHFNNALSTTTSLVDIAPAIDDVTVMPQLCERPINVTVDNINSTFATVHWEGDSTSTYVVDYRPAGTTGTDLFDTVIGLSTVIRGMTANTTYNVWVKRLCAESTASYWSSYATFHTTLCQNSVVANIGSESSTTSANGTPVNNFYKYTLTETIIDSTELVGINDITSIGYYYAYATAMTAKTDVDIWIQPTTKSEFSLAGSSIAATDAVPLDTVTAVKVYHGPLNCSQGWNYFTLDTAYHYSGTGNLMVIVDDNSNSYNTSSHVFKTSSTGTQYKTFAFYSDSYNTLVDNITASTASKTRYQYRVVMKLVDCGPTTVCDAPEVTVDTVGETTATLSWVSNRTDFEVYAVRGNWVEPISGTSVTGTNYTFENLEPGTFYTLGVRTICAENHYSDWRIATITTLAHPCYTPTGLAVTSVNYEGGTLSWTAGEEGQTEYNVRVYNTIYDSTYVVNGATSLSVNGLYPGDYNVVVRAICGEDDASDWSAPVVLRPAVCAAPFNVTLRAEGRVVTVSWQDSVANRSRYRVTYFDEFHTVDDAERVEVTNATTTTVTVAEGGMDYNFYVQAYCGENLSGYSMGETVSIVGIDQVDGSRISLFPNPATSTVTLSGIEGPATVTLVDLNGRVSGQWTVNDGQLTIDLTGYAQGAYFVRVAGEESVAVRKLIVK